MDYHEEFDTIIWRDIILLHYIEWLWNTLETSIFTTNLSFV